MYPVRTDNKHRMAAARTLFNARGCRIQFYGLITGQQRFLNGFLLRGRLCDHIRRNRPIHIFIDHHIGHPAEIQLCRGEGVENN